jgi:hypothetical protein
VRIHEGGFSETRDGCQQGKKSDDDGRHWGGPVKGNLKQRRYRWEMDGKTTETFRMDAAELRPTRHALSNPSRPRDSARVALLRHADGRDFRNEGR